MALKKKEAWIVLYLPSNCCVYGAYPETPKQLLFPVFTSYTLNSNTPDLVVLISIRSWCACPILESKNTPQLYWSFHLSTSVLYVLGTNGTKHIQFLQVVYKTKLIPNTNLASFIGFHASVLMFSRHIFTPR